MRKFTGLLVLAACLMALPIGAQAYTVTITDPAGDAIGAGFETTSISYTPEEVPFTVDITTAYRLSGLLVGSWQTLPADLLLDGSSNGIGWDYAIPLVSHGSFITGTLYTIDSLAYSNEFDPAPGNYSYNMGVPVWLKTGTSLGYSGTWTDTLTGISFIGNNNWYWSDAGPDLLTVGWATATCANDPIGVPEPGTLLLLGSGLVGLVGIGRKFRK